MKKGIGVSAHKIECMTCFAELGVHTGRLVEKTCAKCGASICMKCDLKYWQVEKVIIGERDCVKCVEIKTV